ncbi:hypothetical protein GPECTOR_8g135 [Gonium pectorale]|uniref:DNA polymerase eta n=1 Tax=Gonium pectorale TaxID=33097 RepID=A0A150GSE6_GONPE|nr:hypothetical protein GPECTOR_8g135 [Gonium pectorale]|eukprot:KXZ52743.1 hypothetical protein GPECTOR_8g135 [Gonium pectorale]
MEWSSGGFGLAAESEGTAASPVLVPGAGLGPGDGALAAATPGPHVPHASRARVVAHIDLDAFYCQVEVGRDPSLRGRPVAVIQYNPWDTKALQTALRPEDARIFNDSNGSIIAVSYEARRFGVKRNMSGQAARQLCPELQLVQVPTAHGKADYRQAGQQVAAILARGSVFERASIDEAYLDLTEAAQRLLAGLEAEQRRDEAELQEQQERLAREGRGAVSAAVARAALPPPPGSLDEWHIKGLEDDDEEEAAADAAAVAAGQDEDDEDGGADGRNGLDEDEGQAAAAAGGERPAAAADSAPGAFPVVSGALYARGSGPGPPRDSATSSLAPAPAATVAATGVGGAPGGHNPTSASAPSPATPRRAAPPSATTSTASAAAASPASAGALGARCGAERPTPSRRSPGSRGPASPLLSPAEAARRAARLARVRAWCDPPGGVVGSARAAAGCGGAGGGAAAGRGAAGGLHKPAQQTVVLGRAVARLLRPLPLARLRSLGGKFGEQLQTELGITTVGELWAVPAARLESMYGQECAAGLMRLAAGMDDGEVLPRLAPRSLGCGKTFRGSAALAESGQVAHWLGQLAAELADRIAADRREHERLPSQLTLAIQGGAAAAGGGAGGVGAAAGAGGGEGGSHSRSGRLPRVSAEAIAEEATALFRKWAAERPGWRVTSLAITASRFGAAPTGASTITRFLQQRPQPPASAAAPQRGEQQPQPQPPAASVALATTAAARVLAVADTAGTMSTTPARTPTNMSS